MAKPAKTPTKFSPKMNKTPKGKQQSATLTPKVKSVSRVATPAARKSVGAAVNTPATPKMNGAHKQNKKSATPRVNNDSAVKNNTAVKQTTPSVKQQQAQSVKSAQKSPNLHKVADVKSQQTEVQNKNKPVKVQKPIQQQKQIDNSTGTPSSLPHQHKQPAKKSTKSAGNGVKKENLLRTVRLTFPHGQLKSIEQVKKLVPTAETVKFPNVVFVEFESESEAERVRAQLQPLVSDGQLSQISFVGDKERQFQTNERPLDHTTLFVHGVGGASESDIRGLFPTASAVTLRSRAGSNKQGGSYCFVNFDSEAACKSALEKSKGLTLFGRPLVVNFAFCRPEQKHVSAANEQNGDGDKTLTDGPASKKMKKTESAAVKSAKIEENDDDDMEDGDEEMEDEEDEDDDEDEEDEDDDDEEDEDDDEENEDAGVDDGDGDEDDEDDDEDDDDDDDE